MAISATQYIDLLYKKLLGVDKTDLPANKSAAGETIASPLMLRGDILWKQSDQIPATAAAVTNIVQAYTGTNTVTATADNTTTAVGGVFPTWKTGLTNWIPPEFDTVNLSNTYRVQVYYGASGLSNPQTSGTQIYADGSGGTGEWYFDYKAGTLNFIGGTIPTGMTGSSVIYISGYRYVGQVGTNYLIANTGPQTLTGNVAIANTTASTSNTTGALIVSGGLGVTGNVYIDAVYLTSNNFSANAITVDGGGF